MLYLNTTSEKELNINRTEINKKMNSFFFLLLGGLISGSFTGYLASKKGYSYSVWFFLGFFFSLIALIVAAGLPIKTDLNVKDKNLSLNKCEICGKPSLWNYGESEGLVCKECATKGTILKENK